MRVRVGRIAFRQQHSGAEIDWLSPELREQLALYLDVLYVLGISRRKGRGDFVAQVEPDFITGKRIQVEMASIAEQVPRRLIELLAFPLVHVGPDGVAVRPLETRVDVQQRLHVIVTGGQFPYRLERIAKR